MREHEYWEYVVADWVRQNGDFAGAVKSYSESIKRDPSDPRGYNNRANAYTKLVAFPEALKDAEQAIKVDPKFGECAMCWEGCELIGGCSEGIYTQESYFICDERVYKGNAGGTGGECVRLTKVHADVCAGARCGR